MTVRLFVALLLGAMLLPGAAVRLYMKDGTYHLVREYKAEGDRVRYYSTERGDWEEVPLAMVDLKKTESEIKQNAEEEKSAAELFDAEEKVDRAQRREIERIPWEPGVFQVAGDSVTALKQAELKAVTNKNRRLLQRLSPLPIITGKQTVEVDGTASTYVVKDGMPEFYFRLHSDERLGIVRLKPTKKSRIVQTWNIVPQGPQEAALEEEMENVEVFKQQLAENLYKMWPAKPLPPGEYAVYEFTQGKGNIQAWDFAVPGTPPPQGK